MIARQGGGAGLLVVGIVLAALNLRTAVTSTGALLEELRADLPLGPTAAALLTTLPVLCFAAVGAATPALARRLGDERVMLLALLAVTAGSLLRPLAGGGPAFLAASALALAGAAVGNVLLPVLVKHHLPHRIGPVTALYSTGLAVGTTLAAGLTVPAAELTGGWRGGLAVWGALAAVAVVPWLGLARRAGPVDEERSVVRFAQLRRSPTAWALAVCFAAQSLQAYVAFGWFATMWQDAGASAAEAGALLAFFAALSIPVSLALPAVAGRMRTQRPLVLAVAAAYLLGYVGQLVQPSGPLVWVWAGLVGLGSAGFPLILVLFGLRTRDAATTAAVSASTQAVGYLVAGTGPFLFGLLHQATGGWTAPIGLLLVALVVQTACGWVAADDRCVDDELLAPSGPTVPR